MKILFLDDSQTRHDEFARIYSGHEIVHAYSARQVLEALSREPFDLVSLDHDLGDRDVVGDGLGVSAWIAQFEWPDTEFVVHSVNPVGGRAMVQTLERAGLRVRFAPFFVPEGET